MKLFPARKPPNASSYRNFAILCAVGSIWSLNDLWQAIHSLPALQGVGPLLQGYGAEGYSTLPFEVRSLDSVYGYSPVSEHLPTPVFVIYLRILIHFFFWTISGILFWRYRSQPARVDAAYRLIGTLLVGLAIIDEMVRVKIRGEAYVHWYYANSFATAGQKVGMMIMLLIVLLFLTPWQRLVSKERRAGIVGKIGS